MLAIAVLGPRLGDLKRAAEELLDTETLDGPSILPFGPRPTTAPQLPAPRTAPEALPAPEPIPLPRPCRAWKPSLGPALAALPFTLSIQRRRRRKMEPPPPPTLAEAYRPLGASEP